MKRMLSALLMLMMLLVPAALAEDNQYDKVGFYGEYDMCPVKRDGQWGFVDHTGELIIPCEWDEVGTVRDGRVSVQKDGKWGAIDRTGRLIVPCEWQYLVAEDDGGYTMVSFNGYRGALAADGSVLIPCDRYTYVGPVINGARSICRDDMWGLCTEAGEIITPCQWRETGYFQEDLAWVKDEKRLYGYMNRAGEMVIPCQYRHAEDFRDGSAVVQLSTGYYNLIDADGRLLCTPAWTDMETFTDNDLLMVRRGDKCGYINRRGEVVIPLAYDKARSFHDGLALVKQGEEVFWIDETGARVVDRPAGCEAWPFYGDYVLLRNEDGLYGVMHRSGEMVIPCRWYDTLGYSFYGEEITNMRTETHHAFFNKQGELVTGLLHEHDKCTYAILGEYLFLVEDGALSIWHADGTQVY